MQLTEERVRCVLSRRLVQLRNTLVLLVLGVRCGFPRASSNPATCAVPH